MKKIKFEIDGMHCKSCEMLITEILEETKGVESAKVSNDTGIAEVGYDESLIDVDIIKGLIRQEGYKVK